MREVVKALLEAFGGKLPYIPWILVDGAETDPSLGLHVKPSPFPEPKERYHEIVLDAIADNFLTVTGDFTKGHIVSYELRDITGKVLVQRPYDEVDMSDRDAASANIKAQVADFLDKVEAYLALQPKDHASLPN